MRVGGNKIISIDVRIIAATNESLEDLADSGSFRKDLYYRLNTLPIQIPPLRERGEDIMLLLDHFRNKLGSHFTLSSQAKTAFLSHNWNGNIRELNNYVEYLTFLNKDIVELEDMPPGFYRSDSSPLKKNADDRVCHDVEILVRLAGNKLDEYIFIMEKLHEGISRQAHVGRDSIAKLAEQEGRYLTVQEIRSILENLNSFGLVKTSRGRGGSKINDRGIRVLNELKR